MSKCYDVFLLNLELAILELVVSVLEMLDIDPPDLLGLFPVQWWVQESQSQSRPDGIIQYTNSVCRQEQDAGVELENPQENLRC